MEHYDRTILTLSCFVVIFSFTLVQAAAFQNADHGELSELVLDDAAASDLDSRGYYYLPGGYEDKRAFHAMRGKKDDDSWDGSVDDKRAFHAMRGKRLLPPASVDSFIAQLRRAVLQGKRGSGFFGMRGKRSTDPDEHMQQEDNSFNKRAGSGHHDTFFASRGKRSAEDSRQV